MKYLFQPTDIASLVFFRVIFGILGFADVMGVWTYYHLYKKYFDPAAFHFTYTGFEWVRPLPEPFMSLFFIGLMAAALLIAAGRWYRVCTVIFALGFSYLFLVEKALYLNHGYFFCWLSYLMIFLPAHRNWSWDVLKNPALRLEAIPRWSLWILPFMMSVVYFFGGIAKIDTDWLTANPLRNWLETAGDMPIIGVILRQTATAYFMAWSGLLIDLTVPFFLLFRKTRRVALVVLVLFHLTNTLIFQIGIFPWLSIAMSLLFFPPDFPRRWFAFLKTKIRRLARVESWWEKRLENAPAAGNFSLPTVRQQRLITLALALLVTFHLLVPLRHHLLKGDVAWTEEGHRFSWRMMLRSKRGYGHFSVKNTHTGAIEKVKPEDYLTDRQADKIFTHPDMILQFAHYLRDFWKERGATDVEVYANIRVSLNGRPSRSFVDEKVDLAKAKWEPFRETSWVSPLEK